jgi:hypothetical protein
VPFRIRLAAGDRWVRWIESLPSTVDVRDDASIFVLLIPGGLRGEQGR